MAERWGRGASVLLDTKLKVNVSRSDEETDERAGGGVGRRDALHTTLFDNRLHTQPLP